MSSKQREYIKQPGKGSWHEMREVYGKESEAWREALATHLKTLGLDAEFTIACQELSDKGQRPIPKLPNIKQLNLPTTMALLRILRGMK